MAFRQGLAELGWIEGRNIDIEFRWPGGDIERVQTFAKELVGLRPDVLIGRSTPTTAALKQETGTIPIIFVNVAEPVEQGFVQSLARPGGISRASPISRRRSGANGCNCSRRSTRGSRGSPSSTIRRRRRSLDCFCARYESAAPTFAVETVAMPIQSEADIEAALTMFARQPAGGLIAIPDSFTVQHRDRIIALAARYRLPALYSTPSATPSGGLMAYAVDTRDHDAARGGLCRPHPQGRKAGRPAGAAAGQVRAVDQSQDREGARARPSPPNLLARADEVIE